MTTKKAITRITKHYSKEEKQQVVVLFLILASMKKVSEQTGIPETTLSTWKQKEWWDSMLLKIRDEKQDELDARLSNIIDKAGEEIEERLDKGDQVVFSNGKKLRRKVSARDLSLVAGTMFDKRQILRNQPTSISSSVDNKKLEQLRAEFRQLAQKAMEEKNVKVISVQ